MTVRQLGSRLRRREISCRELVQETIAGIVSRDEYNCFITHTFEEALERAVMLDAEFAAGKDRGPLHGIPIAHKDLFYTRGVKTTAGSPIYQSFVPDFDGEVVANLKAAGAISSGKTNLHELAYGVTSNNPHFGPVLNPRDTKRIPGGSSGGSAAAVAAGLLPMATGTDSGGSIRIPASYCGVTGLKPTYDLLSRCGILPLNFSLDHAGPLGSCIEDCALAMKAMSGGALNFDVDPPVDLREVRVGVPESFFFERLQSEVEEVVRERVSEMRTLGMRVAGASLPDFREVNAAARVIQMSEAAALYVKYEDSELFGKDVWTNIQDGRQIFGHEYVNAQRLRAVFRRQMDAVWQTIDVIVTPTTAVTAPLRDAVTIDVGGQTEDVRLASTRLVRGWNYLGEPALSLPCGFDSAGMPVGMQLIAAPFADSRLLQIGRALERAFA